MRSIQVMLKPQSEFPLLERYREIFPISDKTIFAYNGNIYTNYNLPPDLIVHEERHLEQQDKEGLDIWVENFLNKTDKRLEYELDAYRTQLKSIKDREQRHRIRLESAQHLSSGLYGDIISFKEAMTILLK